MVGDPSGDPMPVALLLLDWVQKACQDGRYFYKYLLYNNMRAQYPRVIRLHDSGMTEKNLRAL
jgi:hypothetical protein